MSSSDGLPCSSFSMISSTASLDEVVKCSSPGTDEKDSLRCFDLSCETSMSSDRGYCFTGVCATKDFASAMV